MQRVFSSASVLATRKPLDLCPNGKHLDGITTVPWQRGRCLAWDATYPDKFAPSHIQASSIEAGAVAAEAETKKRSKYADLPPPPNTLILYLSTYRNRNNGCLEREGLNVVELGCDCPA